MLSWKNISNLQIFKTLRLKKNARIHVVTKTGAVASVRASNLTPRVITIGTGDPAAYLLVAEDSGTRYILGRTATVTVTLPTAEAGLEFWFYRGGAAPTTSHKIQTPGSLNTVSGVICSAEDAAGSVVCVNGADDFNFISTGTVGDYAHVWCDGTNWFLNGMCRIASGMTTST